jgi:hypothetical protein
MLMARKLGPVAKARARKARKDAAVAKKVRAKVADRDGYCRVGRDSGLQFVFCQGPSEWAHFGDKKRFKTVGMPPEERHTTAGSLCLCASHHVLYDRCLLHIEALTEDGCNGPLKFTWPNEGEQ